MRVVSVDPGLRYCGVAEWRDGALVAASGVKTTVSDAVRGPVAWAAMAGEVRGVVEPHLFDVDVLVVEYPQIYPKRRGFRSFVNPNDLLEVAGVVGAIVGALNPVTVVGYLPREWKGSTPKEKHNNAVLATLLYAELALVPNLPEYLAHNVTDSLGLGLFYLGRTLKSGVEATPKKPKRKRRTRD